MSVDVALDNIRIREFPTLRLDGALDLDLDNIRINNLPPIQVGVTQLPAINLGVTQLPAIKVGVTELPDLNLNGRVSVDKLPPLQLNTQNSLKSDSEVALAVEAKVTELPRIDLQFGLRPMKLRFPFQFALRFNLLGIRIFEFRTSGEAGITTEDNLPPEPDAGS
ncbi:MAG: hypothetical protein LAT63_07085 [Marinobacter sp.]|nr:hypothetical protein [Marinobacter sp.]